VGPAAAAAAAPSLIEASVRFSWPCSKSALASANRTNARTNILWAALRFTATHGQSAQNCTIIRPRAGLEIECIRGREKEAFLRLSQFILTPLKPPKVVSQRAKLLPREIFLHAKLIRLIVSDVVPVHPGTVNFFKCFLKSFLGN